jgi:hypothetical protein
MKVTPSMPQNQSMPKTDVWLIKGMLLLIWTGFFIGLMAYEWSANGGSPFLGPFWFIRYGGIDACTVISIVIVLLMLFAFPFKPHLYHKGSLVRS